jgi:hypothetical protein
VRVLLVNLYLSRLALQLQSQTEWAISFFVDFGRMDHNERRDLVFDRHREATQRSIPFGYSRALNPLFAFSKKRITLTHEGERDDPSSKPNHLAHHWVSFLPGKY